MKRLATLLAALFAVLVSVLVAAIAARRRFDRHIAREVTTLVDDLTPNDSLVTESMLEGLPDVVRRYLTFSGVVGQPRVTTVHLHQRGAMHPGAKMPWFPLQAEQWYTVLPPGFVWDGTMRLGPIPLARGRDRYLTGHGNMLIKFASLFTVLEATGPEMDQGAMMRYLSEMIWFPAAFLESNISFEGIDENSARVTLADHGRSVSATMYFDAAGRLTTLEAQRYRSVGSQFELSTWETPITEYGEFEGLKLPVRGRAVWKLPEGDFTYIDVEIADVRYNEPRREERAVSPAPRERPPLARRVSMRPASAVTKR